MKKNYRMVYVSLVLGVLLCISIAMNVKLLEPLYRLDTVLLEETNISLADNIRSISSSTNKEKYLNMMNILDNYDIKQYDDEWTRVLPDICIRRSIPSWGIVSGVYGIYFEGDIAYVIKGEKYEGQDVFVLTKESTERIIEYTGYAFE